MAPGASLSGFPQMEFQRSDLFWRFNLHISYLLDHQGLAG